MTIRMCSCGGNPFFVRGSRPTLLCRISEIFVLLRHESTALSSRGLNSWWRGVERSIARKVGRRAAPELRGQAGRRGRRTPHGTRATDEEGSEHETVMYIGVCGAENFEVTGHVRTEGGHEGSLPPELTYTNVNAHRHVPDPALSSSPREAAHESSRFFFFCPPTHPGLMLDVCS